MQTLIGALVGALMGWIIWRLSAGPPLEKSPDNSGINDERV